MYTTLILNAITHHDYFYNNWTTIDSISHYNLTTEFPGGGRKNQMEDREGLSDIVHGILGFVYIFTGMILKKIELCES